MKPAPFEYHAPSSLDETLALLHELRDQDAKILAGGQSLMPLLNMRLVRPGHVVDVNKLRDLAYVRTTNEGGLELGALTRHRTLEHSREIASHAPLVAEAVPLIGDRQIRYRGTLGGTLAHADPSAELPTVVLAMDAEIVIAGPNGRRTVKAEDFFVTFLTVALEPDEMIVEVRIPPAPARSGFAFLELARQHGDFAIVSAAARLTLENGHIADARVSIGGAGPTPIRARSAEDTLKGEAPSPELFARAGERAAEETDPSPDVHGSAEYRREMSAVFTRRALQQALTRAQSAQTA